MKILHIIPSMNSGGAEKMLMRLISHSSPTITHSIIVLDEVGFYSEELKLKNIKILELNLKSKKKNIFSYETHKKIKHFVSEVDIISSWMYHSNLVSFLYGKFLRKKIIWGIRRSYLNKRNMKKSTFLMVRLNSILSKYVDCIIYNSLTGQQNHFNFGFSKENGFYIPNGFEVLEITNEKHIKNNVFRIINVARWERLKDHATLLKAIGLFKNKTEIHFELILCGKNIDEYNSELQELIKENNLIENVILKGERKDIDDLMRSSTVYVSSSISEGFPNVVAEAMLNKLVCIGTNAGDTASIIQDDVYVRNIGDFVGLSNLILEVSKLSPEILEEIGEVNRRKIINNYAIDEIVDKFERKYFEILKS